jgi:hypothetical protein
MKPQAIAQKLEELRVQRATTARVLQWLESDGDFEGVYGAAARDRHAARERERLSRLDIEIAEYERALEGPLVDAAGLRALRKQFKEES